MQVANNVDIDSRLVKTDFGTWEQTEDEVNIVVDLLPFTPSGTKCRGKDVSVVATPSTLTVAVFKQQVNVVHVQKWVQKLSFKSFNITPMNTFPTLIVAPFLKLGSFKTVRCLSYCWQIFQWLLFPSWSPYAHASYLTLIKNQAYKGYRNIWWFDLFGWQNVSAYFLPYARIFERGFDNNNNDLFLHKLHKLK